MKKYQFFENLHISLRSIKANLLRAILTIFIIAFGIMALVGILTAIDAIKNTLTNQFALMGASSFAIIQKEQHMHHGDHRVRSLNSPNITYDQAREFKEQFNFPALVALSTQVSGTITIKYKSEKTDPNINTWGVDENDVHTSGKIIEKGRNFTVDDLNLNKHLAIVGCDVVKKIFKNKEDPLDKVISIGNGKYKIIGVLKEKGSSFGGWDRVCLLPITNARQYFSYPGQTYRINIMPLKPEYLEIAQSEAEGLFRVIRNLKVKDESDFTIEASNSLAQMLIDNLRLVTLAATIIGIITLFGAAIGLMNIMLVSVTERTSEIGIRKALGAKTNTIKQQFLIEAIVIGQLGGILGIVLGILIGNLVSLMIGGQFILPWVWIITGVILCFIVGVVSGYVPANKAAKVDPIISLRYE
jgi:putative ABC transport system permease protein